MCFMIEFTIFMEINLDVVFRMCMNLFRTPDNLTKKKKPYLIQWWKSGFNINITGKFKLYKHS